MALNKISTEIIEVRLDGAAEAGQDLEAIEKRLAEVEKQVKGVDKATGQAGSGFSRLQAGITTAGAAFAGLQAAAAAAGAAIQAIRAPIALAANFETQFAAVRTLNQSIGDDLKDQLLALAKDVPQTAGDLTQAAYQAISAGIQPTELMGFLTAASQTAVAAGGSLTEAVELLTAGVNAFGRQGETASSISNKLFSTVKNGVTTIPELNAVFGRAAAAASSYGIGVEEVLGAIAQLTKTGLPTQEAVTRVNATIKELANESGTAAKALKSQGVEVGVTALKQKGLVGVLEEVNKATRGQAEELARLSHRQEAVQGILNLTGANMEQFSDTVQTIKNDVSAASDAQKIFADTTKNVNARFEAAKEGALRELGMQVLPALNELLIAMTEELSKSGGAVEALGDALALGVKAITVFVQNAKLVGVTLAAAFGVKYAPMFLKQLAQMRAGIVAFNAMATETATPAGKAYGNLFKAGAMRGIMSIAKSPTILGLGVMIGQMVFSGIRESAEEERRAIEEHNKKVATRELAEFMDREGIRQDVINKRLDLAKRQNAAEKLRLEANRRAMLGEEKLANQMIEVADEIQSATGSVVDLTDQYLKNRDATQEILRVLGSMKPTFRETVKGFRDQAREAEAAAEKVRILEEANQNLNLIQSEAENNVALLEDQVEIAQQDIEAKSKQLEKVRALSKSVSSYLYIQAYGTEAADKMAEKERELVRELELANEVLTTGYQKLYEYTDALDTASDIIGENNDQLVEERQRLEESNLQYERNKKIIEASISPMDRRIQQLKDAAENDKIVAAGNAEKIKAIEKALGIQIAALKKESAEEAKRAAEYKRRLAERKRQLEELEKKERATAAKIMATEAAKEKSINDSIIGQMEATKRLELARLEADVALTPIEKLEERLRQETIFAEAIADMKIRNLDDELDNATAAERERSALAIKDIENSKKSSAIKQKSIKAENDALRANIEALEEKRNAAVRAIEDEVKAEAAARQQSGDFERGSAIVETERLQSERDIFMQQMAMDENEARMVAFEAERELERLAFEEEMTRLQFSNDEKIKLRKNFHDKTVELRQQEADRIRAIDDEQRRSSLAMAQEGLQNLQIAAEAAGASDSFVGKIEAAQIIAKGIFHGFQGASDQAAALSAFGLGNVAQGALLQSAAIAHFAQAAAAPVMARRALSGGGGGGGGAGAAAGGGVSGGTSTGPRTTARADRLGEQREASPAIQFGDIVLADIPALLSKQGARHLGQQIASDVTRAINRSRALPGGARI